MAAAGAIAGGTPTDGAAPGASVDTGSAIVQLTLDPLSTSARTKPAKGKKIDFSSSTVKSYRAQLNNQRNDFKQWLKANAPAAKVTGEVDISLNAVAVQLNGTSLGTIASAPMVKRAQYEGVYRPLDANDPDLGLINAMDAWAQGGSAANAGAGVKVGIIDTGIDVSIPASAMRAIRRRPSSVIKTFTNNKVIVARVFNNKSNSFNYTPEAIQEHGTHVAGTVACNLDTPATVSGVAIPYGVSGVAPRALLGNYNVFPGEDDNARSEDILNALDAAYEDGMDVVNMSLGGNAHGVQDLLTDRGRRSRPGQHGQCGRGRQQRPWPLHRRVPRLGGACTDRGCEHGPALRRCACDRRWNHVRRCGGRLCDRRGGSDRAARRGAEWNDARARLHRPSGE